MPNGKPGDHPFTDIVIHGRDVYSERAASLVRQIAALVGEQERQQLADMLFHDYNEYSTPFVGDTASSVFSTTIPPEFNDPGNDAAVRRS